MSGLKKNQSSYGLQLVSNVLLINGSEISSVLYYKFKLNSVSKCEIFLIYSCFLLIGILAGKKKVTYNFSTFSSISRRASCIASLGIPSTTYYKHNSSVNSIIKYFRHYTLI